MREEWNSLDKIIAAALCEAETIAISEIQRRYKISPFSIVESIDRLTQHGLVDTDGLVIMRTANFESRLMALRHELYNRPKPWKTVR